MKKGDYIMYFISPTKGKMSLDSITEDIYEYIQEDVNATYKIVVGTDSQTSYKQTLFVSALIIHRVGKGARFYYKKYKSKPIHDLHSRIYKETEFSLNLIDALNNNGLSRLLSNLSLEIHIDIGQQGETRKLIQEVVGWVTSIGYTVKIKPNSYAASSVADRYTS